MHGPDPHDVHPVPAHRRIGFLQPIVDDPLIEIGAFTYYDDPDGPEHFVARCVKHHYPFIGDRLIIGRFCAIATGVTFVMNGANHAMTGLSTYPFNIFGHGWEEGFDVASVAAGWRGDTRVGDDVWIGGEAIILPGISIGSGAIVGTRAVVSKDVPPYAIVAGNPAGVVRMRFDEASVGRLLALAWWDWPVEKITRNLGAIRGADIDALERAE
ncbi:CatB-related O-acetyltransferase [Mangrovicella endophytica]|uniref:CatB-related O-acetyltransferase n=1 Tax=Mangrovicella endophytica TaxID=2066697 RepID=UPI000C9E52F4|nr:CatB-related O-acetyltransferase [Mangrovicella endophytica]